MKVDVDTQPNCITNLTIEVPSDRVSSERAEITKEFVKFAKLPGFRPGKAPLKVVERKYKKEIEDELTQKLLSAATREAIKDNDIQVLSISNVESVEYDDEKNLSFKAVITREPEFELPEYKGIAVQVPPAEVGDDEVNEFIERLREQAATFEDIEDRAAEMEDYSVIDFTGTVDGKPVSEVAPKSGKSISENKDFWLKLLEDAFLPGFCPHIVGMKPGEENSFDVEVPSDFHQEELAGLKIHYDVKLNGIKEQVLPEIDDEFAGKVMPDSSLEQLKERISDELTKQKDAEKDRARKDQVVASLLANTDFEVPQDMVNDETRYALNQIVRDNQSRGISDDELESHKSEILAGAEKSALDRVKSSFILSKIAKKEEIEVTTDEVGQRIGAMAMQHQTTPDKLLKDLQKNNAVQNLRDDILMSKTLDFVASNATVTEVEQVNP